MPLVQATIIEGRTPEQKEAFFAGVTRVAAETLGVRPEQVRVVIYEVPATHWSIGGITKAKRDAQASS
jgi:4-oxalocrotonate tautomerase